MDKVLVPATPPVKGVSIEDKDIKVVYLNSGKYLIDGEVIKKVEQEIFATGKAENTSEIGSYRWKEFQTAFHNAYGDSFETQIKLSLKDAEGNPLTATDGTVMNNVSDFSKDYEIVFEKVGAYSLTYNVSDGYNTEKKTITIHVKDSVPPQITIINPITLANVGSNVSVANYQVVDPTDEKVSVRVCVQRPDMSVVNISGKSFKADIKGTYTVMYFAADATGNSAFAYYEVVVK